MKKEREREDISVCTTYLPARGFTPLLPLSDVCARAKGKERERDSEGEERKS